MAQLACGSPINWVRNNNLLPNVAFPPLKHTYLPAQLLAEAYPAGCITVAAESFGESTTSWGAGGLWKPFKIGEL